MKTINVLPTIIATTPDVLHHNVNEDERRAHPTTLLYKHGKQFNYGIGNSHFPHFQPHWHLIG